MKKIEAVILDWAGTIIDYGCMATVEGFIDLFAEYGITIDEALTRRSMGIDKQDHIRKMISHPDITKLWYKKTGMEPNEGDIMELSRRFEQIVIKKFQKYSEPKEYVKRTMDTIRESGIWIGSTTSYTHEMMNVLEEIAASKGVKVDLWVNSEDVNGYGRPLPYMIFKNMEKLGITSVKSVIKVGDTVSDIKEGTNAGVITVGIVDGSSEMGMSYDDFQKLTDEQRDNERKRVREKFEKAGADYVMDNIKSLPYIIAQLENKIDI